MMPEAFAPLSLRLDERLAGRRVVVVGGTPLAQRTAFALLAVAADVSVVSPDLPAAIVDLARRGVLHAEQRTLVADDLTGAWLAYACCGDPALDAAVAASAERSKVWCLGTPDLAEIAGEPSAPTGRARTAGRVLVLGGARSGKSATAESMLDDKAGVEYVATGAIPRGDAEWAERVRRHQQRRPAQWRTTETLDLEQLLAGPAEAGPLLVDCLSTWLAGVMDEVGVWSEQLGADEEVARRVDELVSAWTRTGRAVVAVSSEVGSGVVPATASGRRFRDELGVLNARVAAVSDEVWLCVAGLPRRLR